MKKSILVIITTIIGGLAVNFIWQSFVKKEKNEEINISYGDNSINTNGQIGDNYLVNQKKSRILSEAEKLEFSTKLPQDKSTLIEITYKNGDDEAYEFAKQIKTYLEQEKFNISPYINTYLWTSADFKGTLIQLKSDPISIMVGSAQ